jgi:hypothetical protein
MAMTRFTHIIIILWAFASIFTAAPPVSHATSTDPVTTDTQVLVAPGATPQAIDYTSRMLDAVSPSQPFTAIVLQWHINGNLASIQLAVRLQTANGWGDWQALSPNDEFADPNAPAGQATSTMISTDILATAWQAQITLPPNSASYVTQISAITMNTQLPNAARRLLPSAAFSKPNGSKPPIVARTTWGDSTLVAWDQTSSQRRNHQCHLVARTSRNRQAHHDYHSPHRHPQ